MKRTGTVGVALGVLLCLVSGCRGDSPMSAPDGVARRPEAALPTDVVVPLVEALPRRTLAPLPANRLADGLTPPTNRWFSGLVFGDEPQPVFPLPLAFTLGPQGFGVGLPQVVTSAAAVVGSHQEDVTVTVAGVAEQVVAAYDDASFTVSSRDEEDEELGRTVVAEGSPFVSHVATQAERMTTSVGWTPTGDDLWTATTPTGSYGLSVRDGAVDGDAIDLDAGGSAVFFPVPAGHDPAELAAFAAPVTGTTTAYDVGDGEVTTSLTYGGQEAAFVVMPVQAAGLSDEVTCDLGSFASVYGELPVCRGPALTWTVPRHRASAGLDLSGLGTTQRSELAHQVAADVAGSSAPPEDTYFGGKWLYRQAQLLDLASQVGATEAEDAARTSLTTTLERWTDPAGCEERATQCFLHDPEWRGIVGQTPAFGSEEFNDHHFHYGYFLYAAGVLAAHDPTVVDRLRPVMDLLAADIAGGSDTGVTPRLRVYDVYAGHSWASGTSPFADGNNQESSSEAVTAWAGLALWAQATEDADLAAEAAWLLSSEAAAARTYWTQPDLPTGFAHQVFGISWGGKRDHATWFSSEASAVLGIQLIPMSPSADYLVGDPARIRAAVAEVDGFRGPLADYVLLYSALAGGTEATAAVADARTRPEESIDDAVSRSYLMAFAMTRE
ncbi:glycosyl hydrolase [Nocardioides sp.]|uniref:glycosyl hydrolase n=1 Tax=Nocardioides sp. TaxID=35761 RepID=UPI002603CF93|nr:glycosyl hydrolase [Nocardioides sp.]MCW2738332.1 1,3-beta-glucanase [Nocardioides sp.]